MIFKKPKFWDFQKPNLISYLLLPLTLPILINNYFLKSQRNKENKIFKICVGNIYIGGTGKTPLSIKICNLLSQKNLKSVIIKKFYKDQVDERKLIENYSNLICNKSRIEATETAINQNYKYAVFDDGLQDRSINYDLRLVCFSNLLWIGNGFLIPAGPLRERIGSLKKYDAVILNGDPFLNVKLIEQIKKINDKIEIFESNYKIKNIKDFDKQHNYVIFSGIGNSKSFYELLKNNNFKILKEFKFPDHYSYKKKDLDEIFSFAKKQNSKVITTEKDFVKINDEFIDKIRPVKVDLNINNQEKFIEFIKFKHETN